jgi:Protein of unknown function (DUF2971)
VATKLRSVIDAGIPRLYHYQKYNREHLGDLLENRRIHCSTPGTLNDPWDCRPWYDANSLKAPEARRAYLKWLHKQAKPQPTPEMRARVDDAIMNAGEGVLAEALAGLSRSVQKIIEERRIYCLTPHPDSILMWSHYADNHRGLCLEFDTANPLFSTAKEVIYRADYPTLVPHEMGPEQALEMVYTKADAWAYEDEFRLLGIRTAEGYPVQLDGNYLTLPKGSLKAAIVGCEAPYAEIEVVFKKHAPDLPLKRAVRAPNRYRLAIAD